MTEDDHQRSADIEMLRKAAEALGDHFDTCQIFCTRHMPAELDGTRTVNYGTGNWFARYGQVKHWIIEHEEVARENARDQE
jgi:hypothetical protein